MSQTITVGRTEDLPAGKSMAVEAGGKKLAVFNVGGTYYAIDDTCTHRGGSLSEGDVQGTTVTCPWHAAMFDLASGEALSPPASQGVTAYQVRVENGQIKIEVP